jgi:2-dehydro-3-deoxyphosphogluconate aldolase/(4S)-4-hydroxy-2-oxoglutarate aldolase
VTMTTPGALGVIGQSIARFGESVIFGAGSVLDAETARQAILAGAAFIVAPTLSTDTIALCNRYGVPVIPGIFSPTEALTALQAGAGMVKLFPADVGGPAMVAAFLAPLPQLQIVPVGGVDLSNAAEFIRKGAAALGVGGSLVTNALLESGDMAEVTRRAKAFIDAVAQGRRESS